MPSLKTFSNELLAISFASLYSKPPQEAADTLRGILTRCRGDKKHIFNTEMCAMRVAAEMKAWEHHEDPEFGVPYMSAERWIRDIYQDDYRYSEDAFKTAMALPEVPLEDLAELKRCNAVLLASPSISDTCRRDPATIKAAKTATENEFREHLNRDHGQLIERPETLKFTYPAPDAAQIKTYLRWVAEKAELADLDDYASALLYLAIHENQEHQA